MIRRFVEIGLILLLLASCETEPQEGKCMYNLSGHNGYDKCYALNSQYQLIASFTQKDSIIIDAIQQGPVYFMLSSKGNFVGYYKTEAFYPANYLSDYIDFDSHISKPYSQRKNGLWYITVPEKICEVNSSFNIYKKGSLILTAEPGETVTYDSVSAGFDICPVYFGRFEGPVIEDSVLTSSFPEIGITVNLPDPIVSETLEIERVESSLVFKTDSPVEWYLNGNLVAEEVSEISLEKKQLMIGENSLMIKKEILGLFESTTVFIDNGGNNEENL